MLFTVTLPLQVSFGFIHEKKNRIRLDNVIKISCFNSTNILD